MTPTATIASFRQRDAHARREAQSVFDRPLVIEAGAGSGKTSTLVARIVAWSLGPGWERARNGEGQRADRSRSGAGSDDAIAAAVLGRVVAITFTERAAAEMATRTAEALAALARDETLYGLDGECLPADASERRERARRLLATLDQLVVRTIHSFCRRLLTSHPLESGLHPRFTVDADGRQQADAIRHALETRLRSAYEAGDPRALLIAERGFAAREIEQVLGVFVEAQVSLDALDVDPFSAERIAELVSRVLTEFEELRRIEGGALGQTAGVRLAASTSVAIDATLAELRSSRVDSRELLERLRDRLAEIWTDESRARLRKWSTGGLGPRERAALENRADGFVAQAARCRGSLEHLLAIDPALVVAARPLLRELLAEVDAQMRARGAVNYAGLLRHTRDLLHRHEPIRALEQARIDQLLVDEFQDTDAVQCDIVRCLALSGPIGRRPGLFLVGDPKQSIYGWRSADLRAYDAFVAEVLAVPGAERHVLSVNFRSAPPILAEVERVIDPVMRRREGVQPGFEPLVPSVARERAPGFVDDPFAPVEYWCSRSPGAGGRASGSMRDTTELEADALAQDLLELRRRGVAWSRVGILLRSTADLDTYLGALREADVPYAVERDRSYHRRREIIDAAALVRAVLDPADHLALVSCLRSTAVGVPDAALLPLWNGGLPRLAAELGSSDRALADLEALVARVARDLPTDLPGIERVSGWEVSLRAALQAIATARRSFLSEPADRFVERLRSLLLLEASEAARSLGAYRAANLERFFRELLAALASGERPQTVLRRVRADVATGRDAEEGRPKDPRDEAVQVMTIHAAKGLDFDHVYLMQLHKRTGGAPRVPAEVEEVDGRLEYRVFGAATPGFDRASARRAEIEAAERVRTLYVAMTRARERLVVVGAFGKLTAADTMARSGASHIALLESRREGRPDPEELARELTRDGRWWRDQAGVRWVFPVLRMDTSTAPRSATATDEHTDGAPTLLAGVEVLAAARARARLHAARPRHAPAAAGSHAALRELLDACPSTQTVDPAVGGASADGPIARAPSAAVESAARVSLAVGTVVHRLLEELALDAGGIGSIAAAQERLGELLCDLLPASELPAARARAQALLDRFVASPLLERLRVIAPHVLARELPILASPPASTSDGATTPVGFVSGAIDLVYCDPEDGSLVVVDFKTDAIDDEDDLAARSAVYSAQGKTYARGLQDALELGEPPRVELWFLYAGSIRALEPLT